MWISLRNGVVAGGFKTWIYAVRVRRMVRSLGHPRIGRLKHVTIPVKDLPRRGASIATYWVPLS
jgi:hypothetical protein